MASDVNLTPGESVKVNAPAGERLILNGTAATITVTASNVSPTPDPTPTPTPTPGDGLLVSKAEIMARPTSGAAWDRLVAYAGKSISTSAMLSNQDSDANVTTLACALVAVRKSDAAQRAKVITALKALKNQSLIRALALAREVGAYVIASDLVAATDAEVGYNQRDFYRGLLTATTSGGPTSLNASLHVRPNNWGTHAQGAVACIVTKYGTQAQKDELYKVVKGWLGDRSSYAGFAYGDLWWQADPSKPVGINPKGATKSGHSIDGVLPDDQRRAGSFTWPPQKENYVWEALQGSMLMALVLEHSGVAVAGLSDEALYRAYRWLIDECHFPPTDSAAGTDDRWQAWAFKKLYPSHASSISLPSTSGPGKNLGFTDWLYG